MIANQPSNDDNRGDEPEPESPRRSPPTGGAATGPSDATRDGTDKRATPASSGRGESAPSSPAPAPLHHGSANAFHSDGHHSHRSTHASEAVQETLEYSQGTASNEKVTPGAQTSRVRHLPNCDEQDWIACIRRACGHGTFALAEAVRALEHFVASALEYLLGRPANALEVVGLSIGVFPYQHVDITHAPIARSLVRGEEHIQPHSLDGPSDIEHRNNSAVASTPTN